MKKNYWELAHGAKRREMDRQLLAECERMFTEQEKMAKLYETQVAQRLREDDLLDICPVKIEPEPSDSEMRAAIARAFGRPPC